MIVVARWAARLRGRTRPAGTRSLALWVSLALWTTAVIAQTPATPLAIGAVVDAATKDLPAVVEATARATAATETIGELKAASKGAAAGDRVEVAGDLKVGDIVAKRATDEIRNGSLLKP